MASPFPDLFLGPAVSPLAPAPGSPLGDALGSPVGSAVGSPASDGLGSFSPIPRAGAAPSPESAEPRAGALSGSPAGPPLGSPASDGLGSFSPIPRAGAAWSPLSSPVGRPAGPGSPSYSPAELHPGVESPLPLWDASLSRSSPPRTPAGSPAGSPVPLLAGSPVGSPVGSPLPSPPVTPGADFEEESYHGVGYESELPFPLLSPEELEDLLPASFGSSSSSAAAVAASVASSSSSSSSNAVASSSSSSSSAALAASSADAPLPLYPPAIGAAAVSTVLDTPDYRARVLSMAAAAMKCGFGKNSAPSRMSKTHTVLYNPRLNDMDVSALYQCTLQAGSLEWFDAATTAFLLTRPTTSRSAPRVNVNGKRINLSDIEDAMTFTLPTLMRTELVKVIGLPDASTVQVYAGGGNVAAHDNDLSAVHPASEIYDTTPAVMPNATCYLHRNESWAGAVLEDAAKRRAAGKSTELVAHVLRSANERTGVVYAIVLFFHDELSKSWTSHALAQAKLDAEFQAYLCRLDPNVELNEQPAEYVAPRSFIGLKHFYVAPWYERNEIEVLQRAEMDRHASPGPPSGRTADARINFQRPVLYFGYHTRSLYLSTTRKSGQTVTQSFEPSAYITRFAQKYRSNRSLYFGFVCRYMGEKTGFLPDSNESVHMLTLYTARPGKDSSSTFGAGDLRLLLLHAPAPSFSAPAPLADAGCSAAAAAAAATAAAAAAASTSGPALTSTVVGPMCGRSVLDWVQVHKPELWNPRRVILRWETFFQHLSVAQLGAYARDFHMHLSCQSRTIPLLTNLKSVLRSMYERNLSRMCQLGIKCGVDPGLAERTAGNNNPKARKRSSPPSDPTSVPRKKHKVDEPPRVDFASPPLSRRRVSSAATPLRT